MANTQMILKHIAELYAKPRKDQSFDDAILEYEEKLSNNFNDYDKAFTGISTAHLTKSIDDYWRFKSDKTRPTLAQILAMANSVEEKESVEPDADFKARVLKCAAELEDRWGNFDKGVGERFKAQFGL